MRRSLHKVSSYTFKLSISLGLSFSKNPFKGFNITLYCFKSFNNKHVIIITTIITKFSKSKLTYLSTHALVLI